MYLHVKLQVTYKNPLLFHQKVSCFPAKAQVQKGMAILGLGQKSQVSLPLRQSTSGQNILAEVWNRPLWPWLCLKIEDFWNHLCPTSVSAAGLHLVHSIVLVVWTMKNLWLLVLVLFSPDQGVRQNLCCCTWVSLTSVEVDSQHLRPAKFSSGKLTAQRKNGLAWAMRKVTSLSKLEYAKLGRNYLQFQTLGVKANQFLAI